MEHAASPSNDRRKAHEESIARLLKSLVASLAIVLLLCAVFPAVVEPLIGTLSSIKAPQVRTMRLGVDALIALKGSCLVRVCWLATGTGRHGVCHAYVHECCTNIPMTAKRDEMTLFSLSISL